MFTHGIASAAVVGAAFVFGGLMFGPDLDTVSRQYSRWFFLRFLWFPYRSFFKHRSRFSHGLIFGAFIRVIYFMGVLTLAAFAAFYIYAAYSGGKLPVWNEFARVWQPIGEFTRAKLGQYFLPLTFIGLAGQARRVFLAAYVRWPLAWSREPYIYRYGRVVCKNRTDDQISLTLAACSCRV